MLEKGDKIADYTLVRFLGRGQFGEVWLAEKQLGIGKRRVQHALKFLFNLGDEINLKSAEAEIDTWIEASGHPHVMSVLDMLSHRDHVVIASEFAEGGSLKDWLKNPNDEPRSQDQILEMMLGILKGIEHLHARNIVHRDLKPDNILLQGAYPRIADFGISRIVSAGAMSTMAMGSPLYMSPESFEGSKSTQTDIWSAGVMLYEMLAGELPFQSESLLGLVAAIQRNEPKPLPEHVPPELRRVVEIALAKNIEDRFQTAQEMRSAIQDEKDNFRARLRNSAPTIERPVISSEYRHTATMGEPVEGNTGGFAVNTIPIDFEQTIENVELNEKLHETPYSLVEKTVELAKPEPESEVLTKSVFVPTPVTVIAPTSVTIPILKTAPVFEFEDKFTDLGDPEKNRRSYFIKGGIAGVLGLVVVAGLMTVTGSWSFFGSSNESTNNINGSQEKSGFLVRVPQIELVKIPAGNFMMGGNSYENQQPTHNVSIDKDFLLGRYEVTQGQWQAVMGNNPSGFSSCGENCPVEQVSWEDVKEFIGKLNKAQTVYEYRLPTEAEWEYACRAGTTGDFYGSLDSIAWYDANAASKTHPVGRKQKNAFGLYDMNGNVSEWCEDIYNSSYKNLSIDGTANTTFGDKNSRVMRGGSWNYAWKFSGSANRFSSVPTDRTNLIGFRIAARVK